MQNVSPHNKVAAIANSKFKQNSIRKKHIQSCVKSYARSHAPVTA